MIFTCEKCRYTFDTLTAKPFCPDCGSTLIRPATAIETERYEQEQAEMVLIYNGDVV